MMNTTLFEPEGTAVAVPDAPTPLPDAPTTLPAGRQVVLDAVPTRHALTRQRQVPAGRGRWFDWSANPYRGCEFGCGYCYARCRDTSIGHTFLGHDDPQDFEDRIYVKHGFVDALQQDLRRRVKPGEHIAFGTSIDPYQPIERRERVMRRSLRELARAEGLRVSITTKSQLVVRDIDLLRRVAKRNAVTVNVTITTPDRRLARFLEPRAPDPGLRFWAIRRLRDAGIDAGVFVMPLLPGITDGEHDLRRLAKRAQDAGARYLCGQVVFLREPSRSHFVRRLRQAYPRVAARYEVWTRQGARLPAEVRGPLVARVKALAAEHGLKTRLGLEPPQPRLVRQACFAFGNASV